MAKNIVVSNESSQHFSAGGKALPPGAQLTLSKKQARSLEDKVGKQPRCSLEKGAAGWVVKGY